MPAFFNKPTCFAGGCLVTMIAPDKALKVAYCQELVGLPWRGEGATALVKLCGRGYTYRNAVKW